MSRVPLNEWLRAVEQTTGPTPSELRHVCYVLARFMSGDGSDGCFPGARTLAIRVGVHHSTAARRVKRLHELGWLDVEPHRRQFGRIGARYFPAVPMSQLGATIQGSNVASERDYSANVAADPQNNVAGEAGIVAGEAGIVAPESDRLLLTLTEEDARARESAASPLPAKAGSAAPEGEDLKAIRDLYLRCKYSVTEIWERFGKHHDPPLTLSQVQRVTNDLDRRGRAGQGPTRIAVLPPQKNTGAAK